MAAISEPQLLSLAGSAAVETITDLNQPRAAWTGAASLLVNTAAGLVASDEAEPADVSTLPLLQAVAHLGDAAAAESPEPQAATHTDAPLRQRLLHLSQLLTDKACEPHAPRGFHAAARLVHQRMISAPHRKQVYRQHPGCFLALRVAELDWTALPSASHQAFAQHLVALTCDEASAPLVHLVAEAVASQISKNSWKGDSSQASSPCQLGGA